MVFDDAYFTKVLDGIPEMPWEIQNSLIASGVRPDYAKILSLDNERYQITKAYTEGDSIPFKEYVSIVVNTKNVSDIESRLKQIQTGSENEYIPNDDLVNIVQSVIKDNPEVFASFREGKDSVIQYLIGQVMRLSKGKADPIKTEQLFREQI
jgi:Asp-tRNA(Asn)/Glu-tRNA(Gln) amidotransferase B subunit